MSAARTAVLLLALPVTAFGQRAANPAPPAWKPNYETAINSEVSAAEKAEILATARAIEAIFRRVPELANPQGFEVYTQFGGGAPLATDPQPIQSLWSLWFFRPTRKLAGEVGPICIEVYVNRQQAGSPNIRPDRDASGRMFFVEPDVGPPMKGATVVHEGLRWSEPDVGTAYVTYSRGAVSPWRALSREEYLRALIFDAEGKDGGREASARASLEKTAYQQWLDGAAERKKTMTDVLAEMAKTQTRAVVEEMRKTMETTERETGELFKAQEAQEREQNKAVLATPTRGDELRAQLAAMSPAERASPAKVEFSGGLVTADEPTGHRVLTPDPAFWRVRRSRAETRAITVRFNLYANCQTDPERAALERTWQTLDWAALKRLVDSP
jgi:hypothetical protein